MCTAVNSIGEIISDVAIARIDSEARLGCLLGSVECMCDLCLYLVYVIGVIQYTANLTIPLSFLSSSSDVTEQVMAIVESVSPIICTQWLTISHA